jgi:ABC-type multidrug transport system ATPase subunit
MLQSPSSDTEACFVSLKDVEKRYGGKRVLQVSALELRREDCMLIVGGNGSGKSTLLRVLAGITPVSSGSAAWSPAWNAMRVCYVPQAGGLYQNLTLIENVATLSRLLGADIPNDLAGRWYIRDLGLERYLHIKSAELSGGFQKLAAIACALAVEPHGLFLDEPLTGVDSDRANRLLDALRSPVAERKFLVITDHSSGRFPFANRIVDLGEGTPC